MLVHPAAVTKAVADLEVAWDEEGFEAASAVVEGALEEATADVVATGVEVAMVVHLLAILMKLLLQALPLQHRTLLPTTLHLAEKSASSSMFVMYVFFPTPKPPTILLTVTAAMVHQQRRPGRTFHDYWESRACRDPV